MYSGQQIIVGNRPNVSHSFPDNWQLCSLGEITTSSQYGISSSSGGNYSVPILKMNNLQDGHIDLGDLDYIQLSKAEMESLMLNKGDLLINRTNSLDLVGKAAIYDLPGEHVFASYLVRFRLGPSVLPAFVNYFLNSEPGQRKLKLLATKAVSQANINPSILKRRLFVPIPPILEQHRIVEILCAWDHSINLTTQLIAKKRDIKKAAIQQLLSGKTRLAGFSDEWKSASIEQLEKSGILELSRGKVISNKDIKRRPGNYPIYSSSIKNSGLFGRYGDYMFDDELITWSVDGGGNFFYRHKHRFSVTNVSGIMRVDTSSIDYRFLAAELELLHSHLAFDYQIKAHPSVIRKLYTLFLPSLDEQQAIAAILTDMDAEIAALEQKRDKTRALKQGMMQELLTGKTRLV